MIAGPGPLAPRRCVHRGRPLAHGVVVPGSAGAAAVLAAWQPGDRLLAWGSAVVLSFADGRRVFVDDAPGALLVDAGGVLSSAPLTPRESAELMAQSLCVVHGGVARTSSQLALPQFPIGALLSFDAFGEREALPLGVPPAPPVPPPPPRVDVRAALLGDAQPNPAREQAAVDVARGDVAPAAEHAAPGALGRALLRDEDGAPVAGVGDAAMRWLARQGERLGVIERIRRRTRDYLDETLRMLRDGRIEDGLRHAVPLTPHVGRAARPGTPGLPRPRTDLSIAPGGAATTRAIDVENDLFERLRQSYRKAARQLVLQGRHKEAAFVHIELLGEVLEGVSVLEKSEDRALMRLAAEVAEARGLPAEVVVRQWMIARDVQRAVMIARRHRAFSTAIAALERDPQLKELGQVLRLEQADVLAQCGATYDAAALLWPFRHEHRGLVRRMVSEGLAGRGLGRAELIGMATMLDVEEGGIVSPQQRDHVRALMDAQGPGAADARARFATYLTHERARNQLKPVLAELARRVAHDECEGLVAPGSFKAAVHTSLDGALRADAPTSLFIKPSEPARDVLLAGPPGAHAVYEAALLPNGQLVCALGEAGAVLLGQPDRVLARFAEPASALVLNDDGTHVLLLARRGDVLRISRLDVRTHKVERLIDLRAQVCASTTDGEWLFLSRGREIIQLDLIADPPQVVSSIDAGGLITALARESNNLSALVLDQDGAQRVLRFSLPSLALAERSLTGWANLDGPAAVSGAGSCVVSFDDGTVVHPTERRVPPSAGPATAVFIDDACVIRSVETLDDTTPHRVELWRGMEQRNLHLPDGLAIALRRCGLHAVITDDRARIFVVDMARGHVVWRARVP